MKFRKKPIVIEAVRFNRHNMPFPEDFNKAVCLSDHKSGENLPSHIHTLEGVMTVKEDDWIIKGVNGEFYPCKPDIFEKTYEPVN